MDLGQRTLVRERHEKGDRIREPRGNAELRKRDACAIVSVMFGGGVGIWEIVLLVVLAMILFGAKKLPELGRSAGRGMRELKDSVTDFRKPVEEVKDLVTFEGVEDIAALRSPKTALARILTRDGHETKNAPTAGETQTDT